MTDPLHLLDSFVSESHDVQTQFFANERERVVAVAREVVGRFRGGGKILLFGNGGSAADAQHIAAEFVGRFVPDRPALPALSLAVDPSVVTAIGNDYGYDQVFARQIEALGREGDVALGISTSGNSPNVLEALKTARAVGMYTIGMTGESGGKMWTLVDALFRVPSTRTPRIQEAHIILGHVLAEIVDRELHPTAYHE